MTITASHYIPVTDESIASIPTGEIRSVADTVFDLRKGTKFLLIVKK